MRSFLLTILAAECPFYSGQAQSLTFSASDGRYGILAGHEDMIAAVMPGELVFSTPEPKTIRARVSQGIIKSEGAEVLVLVDEIHAVE